MPRIEGKKVVAAAILVTASVVALGPIYLPYYADRDKIRGMFEEQEMPSAAKREMEVVQEQQRGGAPGSMWKNMKK